MNENTIDCPLCGSEVETAIIVLNSFLSTEGEHELKSCKSCGFAFRVQLPNQSSKDVDMNKLGLVYGDYTAGTDTINERMMKRVKNIAKLYGPEPRLLDVGCGSGQLIQFANDNGWQACGTELNGQSTDERIFPVDICTADLPGHSRASFDLVHCHHVLEHVSDPKAFLIALASYVKPGGYLCVEVPNELESLASQIKRLLGKKYNGATAYFEHLNFFSPTTFQYLMGALPGFDTTYLRTPFIGYGYSFAHAFFDRFQVLISKGAVIEFLTQKEFELDGEK
ncbi:class I SAM-dependent methyltransferase [Lentisphaera marina]|uniref:class I SAM-dependent methyltransferase n=1 Tax=Lentisphaera marina TaxID=1111041 RepID=UPI002365AEC2|nr:class I SAM-dependent methyltransferase [Lentisphaera marina]MDD7985744.1 class I SAM-dependent methyltransferase [Lentisphaera marina]